MKDRYDLARFEDAQSPVYKTALAELRSGRKQSHWMWFIFPQLAALGKSERALFYGIASLDEARAFLAHPVLGPRLRECTAVINDVQGRSAYEIFGQTDEMKLRSCMTLFAHATSESPEFAQALKKYFNGERDARTIELIHEA